MSVVLTVISLGTCVALAYALSAIPTLGVRGVWWSAPIGWALANLTGLLYYFLRRDSLLCREPEMKCKIAWARRGGSRAWPCLQSVRHFNAI